MTERAEDEARTLPTVGELGAWLVEQTGRNFTSPATITFTGAGQPTQEAVENVISVDTWSLWATLGLVDRSDSRRVAALAWIEAGQGECCPARVVITSDPQRTAFVAVHELAHALDWELAQPVPSARLIPELLAIAEGNAQRLARRWALDYGMTPDQVDAAAAVFADTDDPRLPYAVRRILQYPYVEGLAFAEAVEAAHGEAGILDAFSRPPNGAEVLNPDRWFANHEWPEIDAPVELLDIDPTSGGHLGAFILSLMIEPVVGEASARALSDEWLADTYVIGHSTEQSCVAVRIVMRDEASATGVAKALRAAGGFTTSSASTVNFTRCT